LGYAVDAAIRQAIGNGQMIEPELLWHYGIIEKTSQKYDCAYFPNARNGIHNFKMVKANVVNSPTNIQDLVEFKLKAPPNFRQDYSLIINIRKVDCSLQELKNIVSCNLEFDMNVE
jgi:hypothetical protein